MVAHQFNPKPIKTEFLPGVLKLDLFENGIIEMNWDEKLDVIQKAHLMAAKQMIQIIGNGKKCPVYVSTFNFLDITEEAKKYVASPEGQEFTLANAVLIDNLGKKLMFNFFVAINKPVTPTKGFSTKEKAFEWLLQIAGKNK
jgi:hypothetical protein